MNKDKIAKYCLYFWLLILPWQTKFIILAAPVNYLEISFFASWLFLIIPCLIWGEQIFIQDYFRFKKGMKQPLWWGGLIIFEIITFFSIFWAEDKLVALFRYLILVLGILLFYIVKRTDFVKAIEVSRLFLIGLFAPAILGIWQFFSQSAPANKYLGLAYHAAGVLGDSIIETASGRYLRAYGSFDHPNILGGFMAIALVLVLYLSLKKEIKRNERLFYLISFALFYSALLLSFSRSGILAFLFGAFFIGRKAWTRGLFQKKLLGIFIFLLIFISAAIIIPNRNLFLGRVEVSSRLEQKSIIERASYLKQAAGLIGLKPIQGAGVGNYILALKKLDDNAHEFWYYQPVHNYWLLIWSEIGIFGLIGVLIFWVAIAKLSVKKYLWPLLLALFILSLFDHWFITQSLGLLMFFLMAALIFREDF